MIRYALACEHGHEFDAWFGGSADYDEQAARGLVECPFCATRAVGKQIMAPAVAGTRRRDAGPSGEQAVVMQTHMRELMGQVRRHVEDNFDYVGDRFAKEARDIHDGKSEERGIYGEATPKEVKALAEDGVKVAPLPPARVEKDKLN